VDPVLGDISNPQRLNRYAYVGNDPVNIVDPDGMEWRLVECGETDVGVGVTFGDGTKGPSGRGGGIYCIYRWYPDAGYRVRPAQPPPPTRTEDPTRRLPWSVESDCFINWAKDLLQPFFPLVDLSKVPVVPVPFMAPALSVFSAIGGAGDVGAITLYPFVFYDPNRPGADPATDAGLTLWAHEFTHLQQIAISNLMTVPGAGPSINKAPFFYFHYAMWFAWNVVQGVPNPYLQIGYEEWARDNAEAVMDKVRSALVGGEGFRVCP
jgi:hypothetical protein